MAYPTPLSHPPAPPTLHPNTRSQPAYPAPPPTAQPASQPAYPTPPPTTQPPASRAAYPIPRRPPHNPRWPTLPTPPSHPDTCSQAAYPTPDTRWHIRPATAPPTFRSSQTAYPIPQPPSQRQGQRPPPSQPTLHPHGGRHRGAADLTRSLLLPTDLPYTAPRPKKKKATKSHSNTLHTSESSL